MCVEAHFPTSLPISQSEREYLFEVDAVVVFKRLQRDPGVGFDNRGELPNFVRHGVELLRLGIIVTKNRSHVALSTLERRADIEIDVGYHRNCPGPLPLESKPKCSSSTHRRPEADHSVKPRSPFIK